MNIGTKSLLYGAHTFWLHPIFVALAWIKLFGFPHEIRVWIAFVIHDWGYWGKPNMDGEEGETHPKWAASKMRKWFGRHWEDFCLYHSRFYAKRHHMRVSKLCYADKLANSLMPRWLYLILVRMTGEIREYQTKAKYHAEIGFIGDGSWAQDCIWYDKFDTYMQGWVDDQMWERYRKRIDL